MSSKRHDRRRSCEGKVKFPDMTTAVKAAYSHERTFGAWMRAYKCRHCNGFHIGHPPKKIRQAIRAEGRRL